MVHVRTWRVALVLETIAPARDEKVAPQARDPGPRCPCASELFEEAQSLEGGIQYCIHDFGCFQPMRVDPLLPRAEKLTLVLEAIGDDKVRINSTSLDNPLVVLAYEALEVVAIEKQLHVCRAPHAEYLNIDPTGFSGAGYRPSNEIGAALRCNAMRLYGVAV
jgi:hypothetical protein